jgi:methionyl aminopeptidase
MSHQTEEIAKFRKFQLYQAEERAKREMILKIGIKRNDPCWCGSSKKYKRCHWKEENLVTN